MNIYIKSISILMTCNDNDLSEEDPDLIAGTRLVVITHNWTKCFHLYSLVRFQTVCELEDQLNVRDQLTVRNQLTSRLLLIATGQRASTCNNYCAVSFLLQIHQMELSNSCCTDLLLSPLQIQGMGKCTRFKDFAVCAGNFFMFLPQICRALSCSQNGNFLNYWNASKWSDLLIHSDKKSLHRQFLVAIPTLVHKE